MVYRTCGPHATVAARVAGLRVPELAGTEVLFIVVVTAELGRRI
ncbi:hypothetical protein ACIBEJ_30415 [Nonomuraea sp. NPDC050790]